MTIFTSFRESPSCVMAPSGSGHFNVSDNISFELGSDEFDLLELVDLLFLTS